MQLEHQDFNLQAMKTTKFVSRRAAWSDLTFSMVTRTTAQKTESTEKYQATTSRIQGRGNKVFNQGNGGNRKKNDE